MQASLDPEPVEERVRRRLRERRTERGLTLQQVAELAHIDVSTLSRLESGKRRLALDHLPRLAAALGVTTDELIGADAPADPRVRGPRQTHGGLTMWALGGRPNGLQCFEIHISARRRHPPKQLRVHEGHDWLYVLEGNLRLVLGDDDFTIAPGEAVEFTTWTPHWFGAVDGPVKVLGILGPHGERLHLRE